MGIHRVFRVFWRVLGYSGCLAAISEAAVQVRAVKPQLLLPLRVFQPFQDLCRFSNTPRTSAGFPALPGPLEVSQPFQDLWRSRTLPQESRTCVLGAGRKIPTFLTHPLPQYRCTWWYHFEKLILCFFKARIFWFSAGFVFLCFPADPGSSGAAPQLELAISAAHYHGLIVTHPGRTERTFFSLFEGAAAAKWFFKVQINPIAPK